jgi:hypothetical protein
MWNRTVGRPPSRAMNRLCPNPAELPEALERLPHDARLRQPAPVVAVDGARGERARQLTAGVRGSDVCESWNKNAVTQNTVSSDKQPELLRF